MNFDPIQEIAAPRVITIVIAGQRFPMRYTLSALDFLEPTLEHGGVFGFIQSVYSKGWVSVRMTDAARVLWAGCAHMGMSAPSQEECFNAIVQDGPDNAIPKMLEVLAVYINGAEEKDEGEEAQADAKKP